MGRATVSAAAAPTPATAIGTADSTPAGTLDLAIPKLRTGSYFPDWLLERGKRAERALTTVVATCYLLGVSTRRMDRLVETLGITGLSKSQVSVMARNSTPRSRRSGPGRWMPARTPSSPLTRWCSRSEKAGAWSTCTPDRHRDQRRRLPRNPRWDVRHRRDGAGWLTFWRSLTARGLSGVKLVTSDAHAGLVAAIGATLPGAAWQRCGTHYTTNLMAITPKASWPWVRTLLHSVFDQPDAESVDAQYDRVIEALADKLPKVADHLEAARADLLAFTAFPKAIWRQIWSNNPQERSTKRSAAAPTLSASSPTATPDPPRRRSPGRTTRRMGRVRRYLGLGSSAKSRADHSSPTEQEATPAALTA